MREWASSRPLWWWLVLALALGVALASQLGWLPKAPPPPEPAGLLGKPNLCLQPWRGIPVPVVEGYEVAVLGENDTHEMLYALEMVLHDELAISAPQDFHYDVFAYVLTPSPSAPEVQRIADLGDAVQRFWTRQLDAQARGWHTQCEQLAGRARVNAWLCHARRSLTNSETPSMRDDEHAFGLFMRQHEALLVVLARFAPRSMTSSLCPPSPTPLPTPTP